MGGYEKKLFNFVNFGLNMFFTLCYVSKETDHSIGFMYQNFILDNDSFVRDLNLRSYLLYGRYYFISINNTFYLR